MTDRPSWDDTWMAMARAIAQRSRCVRRKAGTVIVGPDNRPKAVGYNGPPAGCEVHGACDAWCPRAQSGAAIGDANQYGNCPSVHSEINALMTCDRTGREGGTIYVTSTPCYDCAKAVSNSGVARAVIGPQLAQDIDRAHLAIGLMRRSGLTVVEVGV